MALDSTAKAEFVKNSLKKYLVDNLETAGDYKLTFDKSLIDPNLQDQSIDQWIVADFGSSERGGLSFISLQIFCCTRKDNEGDKLVKLTDAVFDCMSDNTKDDGGRRITLYDSSDWSQVGALLVKDIVESPNIEGPDQTKYRILTCRIVWIAKA